MKRNLLLTVLSLLGYGLFGQSADIAAFGNSLSKAIMKDNAKLFEKHLVPKETFLAMMRDVNIKRVSKTQQEQMIAQVEANYEKETLQVYRDNFKQTVEKVRSMDVDMKGLEWQAEQKAEGGILSISAPLEHGIYNRFMFTALERNGELYLIEPRLQLVSSTDEEQNYTLKTRFDADESGHMTFEGICQINDESAETLASCAIESPMSAGLTQGGSVDKLSGEWSYDYYVDGDFNKPCGSVSFNYEITISNGQLLFQARDFVHTGNEQFDDHGPIAFDPRGNKGSVFTDRQFHRLHDDIKLNAVLFTRIGMKQTANCAKAQ